MSAACALCLRRTFLLNKRQTALSLEQQQAHPIASRGGGVLLSTPHPPPSMW